MLSCAYGAFVARMYDQRASLQPPTGNFAFLKQERLGQRGFDLVCFETALVHSALKTVKVTEIKTQLRVGLGLLLHWVKICKNESLSFGARMHERSCGRPFVISFRKREKRLLCAKIKSQVSSISSVVLVHSQHVMFIVDVVWEVCKKVGGQEASD